MKPQSNNPVDLPLQVAIEDEQLVIRIGIGTLAFAAEYCAEFYSEDIHQGSIGPYVRVTNREALARDVVRALTSEEEDGTTPLHLLFDQAFVDARDDGSEGFEYE